MSNYIMTSSLTAELDFVTTPTSGTISITGLSSTKVKCDSNGVYQSPLTVSISGYEDSSISSGASIPGQVFTVNPLPLGNRKVKAEGKDVICENDISLTPISVLGTNKSPPPAVLTVPVILKCKNAGQSKVKAT